MCKTLGCKICIKLACCDCGVNMCHRYRNDGEPNCGCYGECYECYSSVNRGENGWPCYEYEKWLCEIILYLKNIKS